MAFDYQWQFKVRRYETGADGAPFPATYVNYLEEGATQASSAYGFTMDWYLERGHFWIVRRLALRFYEPARAEDELSLRTWISTMRRVASHREYDVRRPADGARILRGRHDWIYVNAAQMRPASVPAEFTERFTPDSVMEDLDIAIADAKPLPAARVYESTRRVMVTDLDLAQHVNNAVYVNWCENNVTEFLRDAGFPPGDPVAPDVTQRRIAHEVEYMRPLRDHDPLILKSSLIEYGGDRAAFLTAIHHAETGDLLATDRLTFAYRDAQGPCAVPDALLHAMAVQQEHSNG